MNLITGYPITETLYKSEKDEKSERVGTRIVSGDDVIAILWGKRESKSQPMT